MQGLLVVNVFQENAEAAAGFGWSRNTARVLDRRLG